jgi:hypothetical protein
VTKNVPQYIAATTLTVALALPLLCVPPAPARPRPVDESQKALERLQERLSGAIEKGLRPHLGSFCDLTPRIQLLRRFSATAAKLVVVIGDKEGLPPSTLVFYLRYYEGAWRTTGHEALCDGLMNGRDNCVILAALAIDEIGAAK